MIVTFITFGNIRSPGAPLLISRGWRLAPPPRLLTLRNTLGKIGLSSSCFMLFKVHCTLRFESWRTGYFSNIIDASHYKISKEYEVLWRIQLKVIMRLRYLNNGLNILLHQIKYHPSGDGGTRSPPATMHRLQNPKWSVGDSEMADGVWKGVYPLFFGRSDQLSLTKFLIRALLLWAKGRDRGEEKYT